MTANTARQPLLCQLPADERMDAWADVNTELKDRKLPESQYGEWTAAAASARSVDEAVALIIHWRK